MKRLAMVTASCLATLILAQPAAAGSSTMDAGVVAKMVSAHRAAHGLGPVRVDAKLNRAAQYHVEAMARQMTVSHDTGGDFGSRMDAFGIGGWAAENLAAGYRTAVDVVSGWQTSYSHNANMLKPMMRKVGVASSVGADGRTYWTLVLASQ